MNAKDIKKRAYILLEDVMKGKYLNKFEGIYENKESLNCELFSGSSEIFRGYYTPLLAFAISGNLKKPQQVHNKTRDFTGFCYYFKESQLCISEQYEYGIIASTELLFQENDKKVISVQYDPACEVIAISQTIFQKEKIETMVITLYNYDAEESICEFTCEVESKYFINSKLKEAEITEFSADDESFEIDSISFVYENDTTIGYYFNSDYYQLSKTASEWF